MARRLGGILSSCGGRAIAGDQESRHADSEQQPEQREESGAALESIPAERADVRRLNQCVEVCLAIGAPQCELSQGRQFSGLKCLDARVGNIRDGDAGFGGK